MWKILFVILVVMIAVPINEAPGVDNTDNSDWQLGTTDASEPLTLNQCIKIALEQSSSIRIANLNLQSAKLDLDDARSSYLPEVGVSGQYRFSDEIDFGWEQQNYDAQIDAGYILWDHGRREAGLAQAKASLTAVQSDYTRAEQNLIFNIAAVYYDLLEAGKLIDVNERLLEISRGNVEKAMNFLRAERGIPADVAAARVEQANDELALINVQNNLELTRAELASRMGLHPRTPIEVVDIEETPALSGLTEVPLEDSMARAVKHRPELSRLRASATTLDWSLKLAVLDRWPVILAEYDHSVFLDDYLCDRENFKRHSNWSAMVRFSFPIFDGGTSRRREQNAEIAILQIEESIDERERTVMLEV